MLKLTTFVAVSALALTAVSQPASAGGNGVAAGVVGGLAVGAIIGSQMNRPAYGGPAYYDAPPPRAYEYEECRIVHRRYVDQYGYEHTRRVRVCD
ncbi:MAG TPA: hypothetical protein VHW66_15770 [Stellaceae bacterium]|jgi:hypothetical protein|nr:hypothetical protein [Stellaceae bacterium]